MKLLVFTATAALSLSASMTYGQDMPDAPPSSPPQAEMDRPRDTPPPPPPGSREPDRDMAKSEWRMHPPPRERGARFRIENDRTIIDLRCADGEPTKECADLLLQVLDRLQGSSSSENSDRDDYERRGFDRRDGDRDRSSFR